jgi:hypothetical protein
MEQEVEVKDSIGNRQLASLYLPTSESQSEKIFASVKTLSKVSLGYVSLLLCCLIAVVLVLFFLLMIKPLVFFPADLLMWEETDFVGNMIKLNIGEPLYTAPSDSNSLIYNPAAFLLTYSIAWLLGQTKSIAAFRLIQLGFVVCATLLATDSTRKLYRLAFPEREIRHSKTWLGFTFLALFLVATAPEANKFVYCLHVDALALLVSSFSFWCLVRYVEKISWTNLLLLAICPTLGFLTKQFLISWAAVIFVFLLLHPQQQKVKRLVVFSVTAGALIAVSIGICYLIWGDNFIFWTFEVMGGERKHIVFSPDSYSISLARGFDHLVRIFPQVMVGVVGGWLILRKDNLKRFGALGAAWLVLIASETLSSGAGWNTFYHFGPGILTGAVWIFAALPNYWQTQSDEEVTAEPKSIYGVVRSLIAVASVVTIFLVWQVVPTGDKQSARYFRGLQSSPDTSRYIAEIEQEFNGLPTDKVLLDTGNWIYLRHDVLQKDRAVALADQPLRGVYENFDVTVGRIRSKSYQKILVHDFHSPMFLYEWEDWSKPSGVKEALLENYTEIKTIQPPKGSPLLRSQIMGSGPITVFIPKN